MASEQEHFDASRQFQSYYDETLRKVGARAPQPTLGQKVNDYRRETLRNLKRTFLPEAHPLYQVQFRDLRADALPVFEQQLLPAVVEEANNPAHVPPGELRKIERTRRIRQSPLHRLGRTRIFCASNGASRTACDFLYDRSRSLRCGWTSLTIENFARGL